MVKFAEFLLSFVAEAYPRPKADALHSVGDQIATSAFEFDQTPRGENKLKH